MKDVSLYIGKIKNNYARVLVSRAQLFELLQYAFWNTLDPVIIQQTLRNQSATDKQLRLDNITFTWECLNEGTDDPAQFLENDTIYFTRGCHPKTEPQDTIKSFTGTYREGEIIWKVYWPSKSPQ